MGRHVAGALGRQCALGAQAAARARATMAMRMLLNAFPPTDRLLSEDEMEPTEPKMPTEKQKAWSQRMHAKKAAKANVTLKTHFRESAQRLEEELEHRNIRVARC